MSYLVIARKYRPKLFKDVVGQKHITQTLSNAIKTGHLGHAFLFSGTRGVGKTSTARILAKAINCEEGLTGEPCNKCNNCKTISDGQNVDVIEIDGASNNGVDNIRDLRGTAQFKPMLSRYKVYIIDEVHMLSQGAFNALLKTLEEPPEHVIFIFATTELHKVPETILSRCQVYNFKKISLNEIEESLKEILEKEKINYDSDALKTLAKLGDGSLRDAQSLTDQVLSFSSEKLNSDSIIEILGITPKGILYSLADYLFNSEKKKAFDIIQSIIKEGRDINQFILDCIEFFRELLIEKNLKENAKPETENLINSISSNKLIEIIETFLQLTVKLKYSKNSDILLEMTLFKLFQIIEKTDIHELNTYIKKLELLFTSNRSNLVISEKNSGQKNFPENQENKKNLDRIPEINMIKNLLNDIFVKFSLPTREYLKKTEIAEVTDNVINLNIDNIYYNRVNTEDTVNKLNSLLSKYKIDKTVNFKKKDTENKVKVESKENKKENFLNNELVKKTLEIFDGELIDIKENK